MEGPPAYAVARQVVLARPLVASACISIVEFPPAQVVGLKSQEGCCLSVLFATRQSDVRADFESGHVVPVRQWVDRFWAFSEHRDHVRTRVTGREPGATDDGIIQMGRDHAQNGRHEASLGTKTPR